LEKENGLLKFEKKVVVAYKDVTDSGTLRSLGLKYEKEMKPLKDRLHKLMVDRIIESISGD
jgi:hypothetical protein